jgi:hypothetical protein
LYGAPDRVLPWDPSTGRASVERRLSRAESRERGILDVVSVTREADPTDVDQGVEIDVCGDLREFFGELVECVQKSEHYDATCAAQMYVVELLADHAAYGPAGSETLSQPLTCLLDQALRADGRERFERLRAIGDGVLYVTGFFSDYLETRGLEVAYYSSFGAQAYDVAGRMLEPARLARAGVGPCDAVGAATVLTELAHKFRMFVALIHDVADALYASSARSDRATLRVYERWRRTGSPALAHALAERGLIPVGGNRTLH